MKHIRKIICIILCMTLLTGCHPAAETFEFPSFTDDTLGIRLLSADLSLSAVGQMTCGEKDIILTERVLNGNSIPTDGGYRYTVSETLPGLEEVYSTYRETAQIQGILLYHGFGYLVIEQKDVQSLIPISPDTAPTDIMTSSEFIAKARSYQKANSDTLSGGNGLS